LDEISASAPTTVCEFSGDFFTSYVIHPEDYGLARCRKEDLAGGSPEENAAIARSILEGETGPRRDAILLNAGAAIHIATGVPMKEGIAKAAEMIDSGAALQKLEDFIRETNA
ncbi:MAG: anthranilate phosphoribosyltransferase, partial [Lachnospiraceae bacterium]|nr:anthranilate phosphoribosyltransferase [Lachnospiraceae bacterium]